MKSYTILTRLVFIASLCLVSCGGNESDKARISELESQVAELRQQIEAYSANASVKEDTLMAEDVDNGYMEENNGIIGDDYQDYVGTYEFTDGYRTFMLTLSDDETAQIKYKSADTVCYGSCRSLLNSYNCIRISFNDERPLIFFPSGEEGGVSLCIDREATYIYNGTSAAHAKNPRQRLSINRID